MISGKKLSREQLEKLVQNPHYRLSRKQQQWLDEYRQAEAPSVTSQDVVELHTQDVRPEEVNFTKVQKEGEHDASRD